MADHQEVIGVILTSVLALRTRKGPKVYQNWTKETDSFWKAYHATLNNWGAPFKDCFNFPRTWFYIYVTKKDGHGVALFLPLKLNQCDPNLTEIFDGSHHCDEESTFVSKTNFLCSRRDKQNVSDTAVETIFQEFWQRDGKRCGHNK